MATMSGRGKGRASMQTTGQVITGTALLSTARTFRQFAPNFTVYLLPPDAVCLYSEHRKFFLYGELYCALASAIGEGGWTHRRARSRTGTEFSNGQDPRSPDAAARPRLYPAEPHPPPPAPSPPTGQASACRRRPCRKVSRPAASAFNRSTCRVQRSLPPR